MPLYRAVYLRNGKPRGMTFHARHPALAAEYAYTVLQGYISAIGGGSVLTVHPTSKRETRQLNLAQGQDATGRGTFGHSLS